MLGGVGRGVPGKGSPLAPSLCPLWPRRRPSGNPEADLRSALVPYFRQQRDALQRHVRKQEAENRRLAEAVVAGRQQVQELQRRGQARQQAWQVSARPYPRAQAPGPGGHDLVLVGVTWGSPHNCSPVALKHVHQDDV